MEFRVLGPVEVVDGDTRLDLGGARQRRLLCSLVSASGSVVSVSRLVEQLWDDGDRPADPHKALRTYVARLRRALGAAGSAVVTRSPGYMFEPGDHIVDAMRFAALVNERERQSEPEAVVRVLSGALQLWAGPPFEEFAHLEWLRADVERLRELRLAAMEALYDARLAVGSYRDLVPDLEAAIAEFPLAERFRVLLMEALWLSGRDTEALRSYHAYRNYIVEHAGLEPGEELAELETRILTEARPAERTHRQPRSNAGPAAGTAVQQVATGNLRLPPVDLVVRRSQLALVTGLVRTNRLVTLTGVGGVGKTTLALQAAVELAGEYPDGVWLVELASIDTPEALPDAVADALGVSAQAGSTATDAVAQVLTGRRALLVLDNCEHLLAAAANMVDRVLRESDSVSILATSREGIRSRVEQLVPVPPMDVSAGTTSEAVSLFVQRALAINPELEFTEEDLSVVVEICDTLDGIALAIELAAARMVSMGVRDVHDHLSDRFRLLSSSTRGPDRHKTLYAATAWSYDLLARAERALLSACSVFAGGFDLTAITAVSEGGLDDHRAVDLLDSLVRKSLLTVDRSAGHARYGMLETIRRFAEEQPANAATSAEVRDRHCRYFAHEAVRHWDLWNGPRLLTALDWVDAEFANLRTAFRWAADHGDVDRAATIAAHATMMSWLILRYEPIGWAEEILPAATDANISQLPRLYSAAGMGLFAGDSPDVSLSYARKALELEADARYDPFEAGWSAMAASNAWLYMGRLDRWLEISAELVTQDGFARVVGLDQMVHGLATAGRADEAMDLADEAIATARDHGCPYWTAFALDASGRAFSKSDPIRALALLREGISYADQHRVLHPKGWMSLDAAVLEAVHGEFVTALELLDTAIDSFHRSGDDASTSAALGYLAAFFARFGQPGAAATIYGSSTRAGVTSFAVDFADLAQQLQRDLGDAAFDEAIESGKHMQTADAVQFARQQIRRTRTRY